MKITVKNIVKSYGPLRALDDVSLEIEPGQIVALLGLNGAGKTTLLRCLAGIAGLDDGEIRYDGEVFQRDRIDLRRRFCFLPDMPLIYPNMTVLHHLSLMVRLYERDTQGLEELVVDLLRDFDMLPYGEGVLGRLSRGQRYKAALVALLAVDPELWMLDEPFASGMDPRGLTAFREYALAAARRGRTIVYSTQILELAERFADVLCVIHRGKIHAFELADAFRRRAAGNGSALDGLFKQLHEAQS